MPIRYVIDQKRRLVISTGQGCVAFAQAQSHQERLLSDPAFDASFDQLIDLTGATTLDLSPEEARQLADRRVFSPTSRRALVASKPAIYGMGRLMGVYQEKYAQVRIFHDLGSAREWLGIKDAAGPS